MAARSTNISSLASVVDPEVQRRVTSLQMPVEEFRGC
jgi:hypothetical protein